MPVLCYRSFIMIIVSYKRILWIVGAFVICLILHASSKCESEFECGEECGRPCLDKQTASCPFGFYKFGELCYPLSTDVCPPNMTLTKDGCKPFEDLCPESFIYLNGLCVNRTALREEDLLCLNSGNCTLNSICGPDMVLFNGTCISTELGACPINFTLENGICIKDVECNSTSCKPMECPDGMILINETCIILTCPENSFKINGVCVKCPVNSHYSDGQCIQCPEFMIFRDGLCFCPFEGQVVYNSTCLDINVLFQTPSPPDNFVDTNIYIRNESIPSRSNKRNHIRKVNITNRVNSTDHKNVLTKANGTNMNNLNMTTLSKSQNIVPKLRTDKHKHTKVIKSPVSEKCCIIIHPRKCNKHKDKWICTKRRYHVCGVECSRHKNQTNVGNILQNESISSNYMPYSIASPPEPTRNNVLPDSVFEKGSPIFSNVNYQIQQEPAYINQPIPVAQTIPVFNQQQTPILYQQSQQGYQDQPQFIYQQPGVAVQQAPLVIQQSQMYSTNCESVNCGSDQSIGLTIPTHSYTWPYYK